MSGGLQMRPKSRSLATYNTFPPTGVWNQHVQHCHSGIICKLQKPLHRVRAYQDSFSRSSRSSSSHPPLRTTLTVSIF